MKKLFNILALGGLLLSMVSCSDEKEVIIIEGILIFTCKELRDQMNIKIFVDADDDDRVLRIIVRDVAERGRTIQTAIEHYCETVKPMHLQFIEPSKRYADIIVPQGGHNKVAIDVLTTTVQEALKKRRRVGRKKVVQAQ